MTDQPELDVIDDDEHADDSQEDIGTDHFDTDENDDDGDGVLDRVRDVDDDGIPDEEIDDLPEVGELDPDEEPILDELEEESHG